MVDVAVTLAVGGPLETLVYFALVYAAVVVVCNFVVVNIRVHSGL